ncbi:MAG: L-threonylcarbamoyladenylate synthase [Ferruginibacter sp.]
MDFENDIQNCLTVLKNGGLILYPSDTIWGIGCDATNEAAVAKVYQLKKRADEKSMIILLAAEKDILQYVTQPHPGIFDYLKTVQKPTTVIYEGAINLADNLVNQDGSIAIRIVKDDFCKQLVKRFRKPIVSTSANTSGLPAPANFLAIENEIKNGVDYIVQHRKDDITPTTPSTIVQWNAAGTLVTLRS